jgi:hypothetical protein
MARALALIGIVFLMAAGFVFLLERMGGKGLLSRLGHLPGDIVIRKPGFVFFFPLASGLLVSIVLSLLISVLFALYRR